MSNSAPIVDRIRIIPRPDDFLNRNVGSSGEVFFDREANTLRVYSGRDLGGFEIARADLTNVDTSSFLTESSLGELSIESFQDVMYMLGPPQDGQILVWRTDHWMPEDLQVTGGNGASVDVSDTAPSEPESGNLWLDTVSGRLYIYVEDVDSSQWIQPSDGGSGSGIEIDTLATVTARGAITNTAITINNTLTVDTFQTSGTGTPEISSASSIRLNAPDGIIALNPIKLASYTTVQRNSLTVSNGDMIYNTSTNKFQGYANGVWVDLH
jgi:hypothetical protein